MNLETMKTLDRDDFLNMFGLETRRPATDYVLPALAVFGAGVLIGTGVGLLMAQRPGKELRESIAHSLKGAPEAIGRVPGRVNTAIRTATDKMNDTPIDGKGL